MDNGSLLELRNNLAALPVLQERLKKLNSRIYDAEDEVNSLLKKYEDESLDVEQIKKESLSATLLKLIGKYEGRADKEIQEMLHAKTEYDTAANRIKELKRERDELGSRIAVLGREKRTYDVELKRRREILKNKVSDTASLEYCRLEEEQDHLIRQLTETDEALRAANRAKSTADSAVEHLDKAESWATYDVWFSKGIFSHMAKYDHIDSAQEEFDRLNSQMRDLQKELQDINLSAEFQPSGIDSTTRVIDFWFDNIFTDLNVRDQIRDDQERMRRLYGKIDQIAESLEGTKSDLIARVRDIDKRKNDLIISFEG